MFFGREERKELMVELNDVSVFIDHAFDHHISHVGLNTFPSHPVGLSLEGWHTDGNNVSVEHHEVLVVVPCDQDFRFLTTGHVVDPFLELVG